MAGFALLLGALPPALSHGGDARPAVRAPAVTLQAAIRDTLEADPAAAALRDAYALRDDRPLWIVDGAVRAEARQVLAMLQGAGREGLDPARYEPRAVAAAISAAAQDGDVRALARAEVRLSRAYAAYLSDLRTPSPAARPQFRDPALTPWSLTPQEALVAAFAAPDLAAHLAEARRMHPIYEQLRGQLAVRRADDPLRAVILANMHRARALPAHPGQRYVLVDAAARRVWLYEDGRPVDSMAAIVGTPSDPTPVMAGLLRHAVYRPYWNLPPDVTAEEIAPQVLAKGTAWFTAAGYEALSGWEPDARTLDPAEVDWAAVARGARELRVRKRPGERNVLGQVKLMLPNPLGIYLHDTPDKRPFRGEARALSHGCVRLEDAPRLARRLIGPAAERVPPGDDVQVDLPKPVPVYVTYLTVAVGPDGLERRPDIYGRDG